MNELTDKQKELAADLNTRQLLFANLVLTKNMHGMTDGESYKTAGYKSKTKEASESNASKMLKKPNVKAYMDEMLSESIKKTGLSLEYLDQELENMIRANLQDVLQTKTIQIGKHKTNMDIVCMKQHIQDLPEELARCLDEVKMTTSGISIKKSCRLEAIKLAYARFGGLKQNILVDTKDGKGRIIFEHVKTGAEIQGAD